MGLRDLFGFGNDRMDGGEPSPESELEAMDEAVRLQGEDEEATMFDPDTHPKEYDGMADKTEPIADDRGTVRDIELDTPPVEEQVGDTDRNMAFESDPVDVGFDELDDPAFGMESDDLMSDTNRIESDLFDL